MHLTGTHVQQTAKNRNAESDEDLYARIGAGQGGEAFRILYERHAARVFAYCARILGSRDDAKDVFQDTFIALYRKAAEANPGATMRVAPYLYTIAHHRCISVIRMRKQTVPADDCLLRDDEHPFEQSERSAVVRLAIELLPLEYREPLILRQYNDVPYADIAEILSIPVSTVKIRIHRAKEKLRSILAPYFKEP
jgi:RNA polymerase sigma-70 factor (ECF subfamily)